MYQKSDIQILIATMNRTDFDFLKAMFVFSDFSMFNLLVINQTSSDKQLKSDFDNVEVINSFERGLSNSRNLALQKASKELVILTDDDVVFQSGFEDCVLKAFNSNPTHDGFRFQFLNGKGNLAKKYPKQFEDTLSDLEILNSSSVELVFKRRSILESKVQFDTDFGIGTQFSMGEEAIFVADVIKKGLKIGFIPETLVAHSHPSTGHKTDIYSIYFIQSAVFYRIFPKMYLFWVLLKLTFDLKHRKVRHRNIIKLLIQAKKGKKAYVNHTKL
jgi:hypothetical protein